MHQDLNTTSYKSEAVWLLFAKILRNFIRLFAFSSSIKEIDFLGIEKMKHWESFHRNCPHLIEFTESSKDIDRTIFIRSLYMIASSDESAKIQRPDD